MRGLAPDRFRDSLLIALALASGSVDAISWLGLGKAFSAFMTGNLAFLGFRIGGNPQPSVVRTLAALVGFAAGAWLGGRVVGKSRLVGVWPRKTTRALGLSLVPQAVFLTMWMLTRARPSAVSGDVLIGVSALAMGIRTTAVFALGVRASFTTAATATFAVLMGDVAGWSLSQRERLRLLLVIVGVLVGALVGTLLYRHIPRFVPLLPLLLVAGVTVTAELTFGADGDLDPEEHRHPGPQTIATGM